METIGKSKYFAKTLKILESIYAKMVCQLYNSNSIKTELQKVISKSFE